MAAWVLLRHEPTGNRTIVPRDPAVLDTFAVRDWREVQVPAEAQPFLEQGDLAVVFGILDRLPDTDPVLSEAEIEQLHGPEVDEQLRALGQPTTGKVADRKARLADAQQQSVAPDSVQPTTTTDDEQGEQ